MRHLCRSLRKMTAGSSRREPGVARGERQDPLPGTSVQKPRAILHGVCNYKNHKKGVMIPSRTPFAYAAIRSGISCTCRADFSGLLIQTPLES